MDNGKLASLVCILRGQTYLACSLFAPFGSLDLLSSALGVNFLGEAIDRKTSSPSLSIMMLRYHPRSPTKSIENNSSILDDESGLTKTVEAVEDQVRIESWSRCSYSTVWPGEVEPVDDQVKIESCSTLHLIAALL